MSTPVIPNPIVPVRLPETPETAVEAAPAEAAPAETASAETASAETTSTAPAKAPVPPVTAETFGTPAKAALGAVTTAVTPEVPALVDPSVALAAVYAKSAIIGRSEREEYRLSKMRRRNKPLTPKLLKAVAKPDWPSLTPQEAQLWDLLSDPTDRRPGQKQRPDKRFTLARGTPRSAYEASNSVPEPDDFWLLLKRRATPPQVARVFQEVTPFSGDPSVVGRLDPDPRGPLMTSLGLR